MLRQSTVTINPVSNYSFGTKAPKVEKDTSVAQRMERLKEKYAKEGVRKSVDAVLLVYEHGHPHILLLQIGSAFFKLPGGRLRPGEGDVEGLLRKLGTSLSPEADHLKPDWRVGEILGTYYRPNFENILYPYCPPHISRPKEIRRLFLVHLPEKCFLAVPKNYRLVAVPLFEIYDHTQRYGPVISSVPQMLSRFNIILAGQSQVPLPIESQAPPTGLESAMPQGQTFMEQPQQEEEPMPVGQITISLQPQAGQPAAQPQAAVNDDFTVDFEDM